MILSSDWKSETMTTKEKTLNYNMVKSGRKSAKNKWDTGQRRETRVRKSSHIQIFIFTCQYDDVTSIPFVKWGMNWYVQLILFLMQKEFRISMDSFKSYIDFKKGMFLLLSAYARARRFLRFFARAGVNIGLKCVGKVSNDRKFIRAPKSIEKTAIFYCIKEARARASIRARGHQMLKMAWNVWKQNPRLIGAC